MKSGCSLHASVAFVPSLMKPSAGLPCLERRQNTVEWKGVGGGEAKARRSPHLPFLFMTPFHLWKPMASAAGCSGWGWGEKNLQALHAMLINVFPIKWLL